MFWLEKQHPKTEHGRSQKLPNFHTNTGPMGGIRYNVCAYFLKHMKDFSFGFEKYNLVQSGVLR